VSVDILMLPYIMQYVANQVEVESVTPRTGYLVDVYYNNDSESVCLIFLDIDTQEIFRWYDNTGHRSYVLTDASQDTVMELVGGDREFLDVKSVTKYDAILDRDVELRQVIGKTPYAIGGESRHGRQSSFRRILGEYNNVWEGNIRYENSYCYDNNLVVGMPYIVGIDVIPMFDAETQERISESLTTMTDDGADFNSSLEHWVKLFEHDIPEIKMVATDIEVEPEGNAMPNAQIANQPIIAISFVSKGKKLILVLKRPGIAEGTKEYDGEVMFFVSEYDLLLTAFDIIRTYPFVITFNGDGFDLLYMYNRSRKLRIPQSYNPIRLSKRICRLENGIHIDLYPFMKNPSIQNYAFGAKYKQFKLEDIAQGVLGYGKIDHVGVGIGQMDYTLLANYCLLDSEIVYNLMTFGGDITINLIMSLCRMANTSVYNITRRAIGDWVKGTFCFLSRMRGNLIPNQSQLRSKGSIQTVADIKGKKYRGAIVQEPKPGIFFKVVVMDFASLYPTEVKERNIGHASINCGHPECRSNIVPDTTHHICTINRAIESEVIGALRDVRIFRYKALGKTSEYYNTLQQAIKVYINAAYGVFGSEVFDLYCAPVAEAIASYSRDDMTKVVDRCDEMGIIIIGGDTDSVFLHAPTKEQTAKIQSDVKREQKLDLGIDKVYRYAIFSTRKKNYLGIGEDGKADIKGLTGKKSNTPPVVSKPFFKVIEILEGVHDMDEYDVAREETREILREAHDSLKKRSFNVSDMLFEVRLSRDPDQYTVNAQHVKAAKLMIADGFPIKGGESVKYVKTTTKEGVLPSTSVDISKIDTSIYIDQLESTMNQLLESMDIDFESEIKGNTTLLMFFGDGVPDIGIAEFMKSPTERKIKKKTDK
jgi:DNA polymerase, archaea type